LLSVFTLYLSILFIVGGLPITASADETLSRSTIDELVVVVRKKEEQLFEVPVSVSVFSNKVIQELGLNGLADIARYTPGFSSSAATGRQPASNRPSIRGLTTIRNGIANTSAATVFIDGVYVGGSPQSTELTNLDRIEILRGPQTALYGQGPTLSAMIRGYLSKQPSLD